MREYDIEIAADLKGVDPIQWDQLSVGHPCLQHAWLQSMIDAGCTTAETGWLPQFVLLWRNAEAGRILTGAVPLYMKGHSYGEYVFDWAWADAYARAGLDYYPKLVAAVPFTPCTGARLMAATDADRQLLLRALNTITAESEVSSLHVLYPTLAEQGLLLKQGFLARQSVQFHWQNQGYTSFEQFLGEMSHDKRKRIKQERRRVRDAGIQWRVLLGGDILQSDWDFFERCYQQTYREHHSTPYLNRRFFGLVGERMPDSLLLIVAELDGQPIAASLNLLGTDALYGRYWGTRQFISGLHFEACYYQTIEYSIANKLSRVEGGAQGEHKLARGFTPVTCHSAHLIKDQRFAHAIADFLARETAGTARYASELNEHSPFKESLNVGV
ncbi:MAG: GNAT family N-acetyltransferase [Burkholderiales bacterium]